MGPKLHHELTSTPTSTPPKLELSSFPSHKVVPPASPWALTPPLQPMVSIPFEWEEAPGRPRPGNTSTPCKPKSVRCLELPPRLLVEAKVTQMSSSPTTVLDGPRVGRSLSHRFCFEGPSSNSPNRSPDLGLVGIENDTLDQGKCKNDVRKHVGPWRRWASGNGTKWNQLNQELSKGTHGISSCHESTKECDKYDMEIEIKITRFRRRSKGSLYKLSHSSSRVLENILECIKQIVVRRRKQEKQSSKPQ